MVGELKGTKQRVGKMQGTKAGAIQRGVGRQWTIACASHQIAKLGQQNPVFCLVQKLSNPNRLCGSIALEVADADPGELESDFSREGWDWLQGQSRPREAMCRRMSFRL